MTKMAVGIPEAAEMIGLGRSSIYKLFDEKKLTPRKSGRRTLVLVEEIERYVKSLPAAA